MLTAMVSLSSSLLIVTAALGVGAALARAEPESAPVEREQQLLDEIDALRAQGGLHAEGLIEPLRALGMLYQESGDHVLAAVALREARQVLRANRGLFSATVDEAVLLNQLIRSEKALGNGERAWNLQHDLLVIARQNLDDLRMLPIFEELIEDRAQRLDTFTTTNFRDLPPGLYVPCGPDGVPIVIDNYDRGAPVRGPLKSVNPGAPAPVSDARNCVFGTYSTVVARLQEAVLRHHADAIAVLIRSGDYASQELRELEREALTLVPFERGYLDCSAGTFGEFLESELVDSCLDTARGSAWAVGGWASLMRLVFYEVRSDAPAAARAKAFAELGDWYLRAKHLSDRFSLADEFALKLYEQGLADLRQGDATRESVAEIFSPELPVTLPTYAPNPLASTPSARFIDVAFAITRDGRAESIEILNSSQNATRGEQRELGRLIKYASFRPRVVDGELAASAPVVVRYYVP